MSLAGRPAPRGRSTGTLDRVMPIGVVFPRNEFGGDVGAVGAYAQGVVLLGYPLCSASTMWSVPTPRFIRGGPGHAPLTLAR